MEDAPKRFGSGYARKCVILKKKRLTYLVRIRNQISMQKVYEAFHLALRQGKTCQLCNGRPRGQLCCTESDSMCTSRSTTTKKVTPDELVFSQHLCFLWHCQVHVKIARCPVNSAAHVILEYWLGYKTANKTSSWIMSPIGNQKHLENR